MSYGYQPREPNVPRYCEVVQIGIEEDTAEVTLFYTTEREFQVNNGYVSEDKEESNYDRRYRKLKLVTSKANVIEVRRYRNGEYDVNADGREVYIKRKKVEV